MISKKCIYLKRCIQYLLFVYIKDRDEHRNALEDLEKIWRAVEDKWEIN